MHWADRSTRWDRDEGYRPTHRGGSVYGDRRYDREYDREIDRDRDRDYGRGDTSYPGGFEDRPAERGLDEEHYARAGYEGRGGFLGQGGQQMGYAYGARGTHRYGEHGYLGYPSYRGKGPAGFTRSDERIRELVCEALTDDHYVDATNLDVSVRDGEVILSGTVDDRQQKRMAEACVERVGGVKDVHNQIRVRA